MLNPVIMKNITQGLVIVASSIYIAKAAAEAAAAGKNAARMRKFAEAIGNAFEEASTKIIKKVSGKETAAAAEEAKNQEETSTEGSEQAA